MELRFEELEQVSLDLLSELLTVIKDGFQEETESIYFLVVFIRFGRVFVAYHKEQPVALIQAIKTWSNPKVVHFVSLAVKRTYRGKGVAKGLAKFAMECLTQKGVKTVGVHIPIRSKNTGNTLQRELGFQVIEEQHDYYGKDKHRLYLRRELG